MKAGAGLRTTSAFGRKKKSKEIGAKTVKGS